MVEHRMDRVGALGQTLRPLPLTETVVDCPKVIDPATATLDELIADLMSAVPEEPTNEVSEIVSTDEVGSVDVVTRRLAAMNPELLEQIKPE